MIEPELQTFVLTSILEIKVENCLKIKARDIINHAQENFKEMQAKSKAKDQHILPITEK
jgi:hypothetical protein